MEMTSMVAGERADGVARFLPVPIKKMKSARFLMTFAIFASMNAQTCHALPPAVEIAYSPALDSICALTHGHAIKSEWSRELEAILPDYREEWSREGPRILKRIEELTNKRFTKSSLKAHVTLCDIPSNSIIGITVNMRYALSNFTSQPVSLRYKSNVLTHEILHEFLDEYPIKSSALIQLHADEDERVKNHLHLFALLKAALLDLDEKDALGELIRVDSQLPGGAYKRAWELINQTPDEYMRYVEEVRNNA